MADSTYTDPAGWEYVTADIRRALPEGAARIGTTWEFTDGGYVEVPQVQVMCNYAAAAALYARVGRVLGYVPAGMSNSTGLLPALHAIAAGLMVENDTAYDGHAFTGEHEVRALSAVLACGAVRLAAADTGRTVVLVGGDSTLAGVA